MFIGQSNRGYTSGGQVALGTFLMLFQKRGEVVVVEGRKYEEIRAAVRRVRLAQCGQWMMGQADLWGHAITLSGTYGEDGFPMDLKEHEEDLWPRLHALPDWLHHVYWTDDTGWNSAGVKSGPAVQRWASFRVEQLRRQFTSLKEWDCAECGRPSLYVTAPTPRKRRYCAECREAGKVDPIMYYAEAHVAS